MSPTLRVKLRYRISALATALAIVGGLAGVMASPAPAAAADDGGFGAKMLELVNQHRATAKLAPLQWSASLATAAQDGRYDACGFPVLGRATDMGARNYFSHSILGCGTQSVFNLLGGLGIKSTSSAENIAWMNGTTDPILAATRLTNDLMASPGHKANILSTDYTHVGIGSWRTAPGQTWSGGGYPVTNVFLTAQVFGRIASTTTPTTTPPTTTPPTTTPRPAPVLPSAPTAVVATGGDGALSVSWAPAASGPAVDAYAAFVWDAAGYTNRFATACATCRSTAVTGLTNGRTYYVTVQGHNAAGWGATAYSGWVTVAAVPGPPTAVRAVPGNGSVTVTWRTPTNPGTAIDGHALFIFDAAGYTGKYAWVCATCTTATVAGLVNGQSYYGLVYAHNANGWGAYAVTDSVIAGTPAPVGNVAVTRGNGSVAVSWTRATSSTTAIDLYAFFVFDANGYTGIYGTACATCTSGSVSGLTNGRTYSVAVYPHNSFGFGPPTVSSPVVPAAI